MPSDVQYHHRRQKGPPADKREALEDRGVAKKADQGQKAWDKLVLPDQKPWEEVLPVWQQLQWYKYTGSQKGLPIHAVPELPSGTGTALETVTTTAVELPTTLDAGTGPGALDHTTAALLMTLGKSDVREQGQKPPFQNANQTDESLEPGAQSGFPRFLCTLREAAEEYVQYEVQQCDVAIERWRSEYTKARRQLNASETARQAMEQKVKRQLQTALQAQEERLLQQQADLVLKRTGAHQGAGDAASELWSRSVTSVWLMAAYLSADYRPALHISIIKLFCTNIMCPALAKG
ncbi:hypothetical protein WJX73_010455 [Symbiochloris irregularis]|uniref:Uncharacterized protein n=1 Tax=Symbiochloris irregularis TaxID=706552 RepID=A0AAW1NUY1_9CHLO